LNKPDGEHARLFSLRTRPAQQLGEMLLTLLTSPQIFGLVTDCKRLPINELRRFGSEENAQKISRGQI
jgi:hypothetical protein